MFTILNHNIPRTEQMRQTHGLKTLNFKNLFANASILEKQTALGISTDELATRISSALASQDLAELRVLNNYFYQNSGMYKRLLSYLANLFTMDYYIVPNFLDGLGNIKKEKIIKELNSILFMFDNMQIKQSLKNINFNILLDGSFFGYIRQDTSVITIQKLNPDYCISRYKMNGRYCVEFNVKYFDEMYRNETERSAALAAFPKEISKAYNAYKAGKLKSSYPSDYSGMWILLDINNSICFKITEDGVPFFAPIMLDILNISDYKEIEKERSLQELYKLFIQKMPLDKDGNLIFDIAETEAFHTNGASVLADSPGVDILTTFADVEMINLQENNRALRNDLEIASNSFFNESGTSKMIFSATGNIALDKSVKTDEGLMQILLDQYEFFLNSFLQMLFNNRKYYYQLIILPITIFNRQEMSKFYREQASYGYTRMPATIASGISQSAFLASLTFENDILNLSERMIPLSSSYTQSGGADEGRPAIPDEQKTDKTIQNNDDIGG